MRIKTVILAAGQGTRMRSSQAKVMHPLVGHPMLYYVIKAAQQATGTKPTVVVGQDAQSIQQAFFEQASFVIQEPQLGTAHAVQQAESILQNQADLILVTYGDMPLLSVETLEHIIEIQKSNTGPMTMLTLIADDPRGFGRVVRDPSGQVKAIIEEAQATHQELTIRELNASVYCFNASWLWQSLHKIPISPKGEYYLTDLAAIAVSEGVAVQSYILENSEEGIGINTRLHLAEAAAILRRRINNQWMLSGVTMIDPLTTYIDPETKIGQDSVIWPNTHLMGRTEIGADCTIGPNSIIQDSRVGDCCTIISSILEEATVEADVQIGPFAHLRQGTHLASGVHVGNFGEVKNSYLGPGTKLGHFSYIGDAQIGADVNIGAGTITCNFDGEKKNPTEIESHAFIGSDTMLIAPVKIGEGARTGAGSVVTRNIPPYTLAVGIPARAIRKLIKRD